MRAHIWTTIGFVAVASTISVPAQQPQRLQGPTAPGGAPVSTPAGRALPAVKTSAFTTIQGNAISAGSAALAHSPVRLRDARVGRIVKSLYTDDHGLFVFRGLDPGSYIVELMSGDRTVLAASGLINVNAGDVGSAIVREPNALQAIDSLVSHAQAHAASVSAAAAASGVLTSRVPGDDVSPR